jgi:hypothetical protein
VGSGLELKHTEKGKIELTWGDFFHLYNGLAAGAFTGATGAGKPCLRFFDLRDGLAAGAFTGATGV